MGDAFGRRVNPVSACGQDQAGDGGDLDTEVQVTSEDEVGRLTGSFNTADAESQPSNGKRKLQPWTRRLWIAAPGARISMTKP